MTFSGMLRRVALVRTDVPEELNAPIIRETRIGELGTTLAVTSNRRAANVVLSSPILITLMMEALSSSETSVLTRATRRNIPEDAILHFLNTSSILKHCFDSQCASRRQSRRSTGSPRLTGSERDLAAVARAQRCRHCAKSSADPDLDSLYSAAGHAVSGLAHSVAEGAMSDMTSLGLPDGRPTFVWPLSSHASDWLRLPSGSMA
jgi:hypothetical protein